MKILNKSFEKNTNNGEMTLISTKPDDFFMLSKIISPLDKIKSLTTRKLSLDGKSQSKINCVLEISVETVDADLEDGILYVKGKTCKIHERVPFNVYHTLSIPLEQKFTITKDNWKQYDIKMINDATHEKPEVLFILFFENDCVLSLVGASVPKVISKHEPKQKNFKSISNAVKGHKNKVKTFVVASTLSIANDFYKYMQKDAKDIIKNTALLNLSNDYKNISNAKAISKILSDKNYAQNFADAKYVEELAEIETFFESIEKQDKLNFFGFKQLKEGFDYGAVSKIFITDELYKPHNISKRKVIEKVLNEASLLRAKIFIVPVMNELGEKLKSYGGIAGKLSFLYK
ncbi:dom34 [Nucleospora cyclopteri]